MNDLLFFKAIRKLPPRYLLPGVDVTRFGEGPRGYIVASHAAAMDTLPTLIFRDGHWARMKK